MSGARPRQGESISNKRLAFKSANDLPTDFLRHHKDAQRDKFRILKLPHFLLQGHASTKFLNAIALANHNVFNHSR